MSEKQFAFIPWWVANVLSRNNLKSEDLLSFERIQPFFSTEDLTSLVALSYNAHLFSVRGIESDITQWTDRWLSSTTNAKFKQTIMDIATLANSKQVQDETLYRVLIEQPSDKPVLYEQGFSANTFDVTLMGDVGIAVWLKEGFSLQAHAMNSFKLLRCMVKKLYVYENYETFVSRQVGKAYIELLMH